jgi:hypothetical protein
MQNYPVIRSKSRGAMRAQRFTSIARAFQERENFNVRDGNLALGCRHSSGIHSAVRPKSSKRAPGRAQDSGTPRNCSRMPGSAHSNRQSLSPVFEHPVCSLDCSMRKHLFVQIHVSLNHSIPTEKLRGAYASGGAERIYQERILIYLSQASR